MGILKRDFERFEKENKNIILRNTEEWKEETLSKINSLTEFTQKIEEETRKGGEAIKENFDAKEVVNNIYNQLLNTNPEKSKNIEKTFNSLKKIDDEIKNISKKIEECINLESQKTKVDKIFTPLNSKLDEIIKKLLPQEKIE
jgi:chromosome condensin MukBEF complex kleisin-like MukF subunit